METTLAMVADTVWFTPALLVLVALMALLFEVVHEKSRASMAIAGPRAPGESLRLDMNDLNEKLIIRLLITVGVAVLTGMAAKTVAAGRNLSLVYGVMFTGSGLALALTLWTWRLVARWRKSNLGLEGERMVGRELNLLMLDGCRVFHDLVNPRFGNIDHIIVGHHAIFVVETTVLKPPGSADSTGNERVRYDGRQLSFPSLSTDRPIKQALRNARWLERYIAKMAGLKLHVHPIVTLPGWIVERSGHGPVHVVNPKEISSLVVDRAAAPLYEAQRQRIINLLDQRCQTNGV